MVSPRVQDQSLEKSVEQLRGVGPKLAALLAKASIHQVKDLLFRLPLRYLDKTRITPIGSLRLNTYVVIQGEIKAADILFGRRRSLMVKVTDGTGVATLRFFHFSMSQKTTLGRGKFLRCSGEVRHGRAGLELYHPEYEFVDEDAPPPKPELTPIYSTTEGLTQHRLRDLTGQAIQLLKKSSLEELLIEFADERSQHSDKVSLKEAVIYLHRPPQDAPVNQLATGEHPYQKRIVFEELVAHQLSLLKARSRTKAQRAVILQAQPEMLECFYQQLGFSPTGAQHRVIAEICSDLVSGHPMLRLLQGDVGAGKTLVAAVAMIHALGSGKQAVLMAPTEILAEQHLETLKRWLAPFSVTPIFLSGKTKGKAREAILAMLAEGRAKIAVGTHALFQDDVLYADLGLVVIDEQHRFGVNQRITLGEKGKLDDRAPHQLIMTATPIPRTLAMSHYSDLDTSVIDELPPGRTPVETVAVPALRRTEIIDRVRSACQKKRQVYWVCTLIEESETLQAQAAEATADELKMLLSGFSVGLIHGRMKPSEKAAVMADFKAGTIHVLVATTVIEVGVDVPNASLMIIENPERLGLSQLHQLRGRVGRGSQVSHCVLLYESPLSEASAHRINAMRQTNDGFEIADIDLKLRGPGELLGARQAGDIGFLMADLQRDAELLPKAQQVAQQLFQSDGSKAEKIIERWMPNSVKYMEA